MEKLEKEIEEHRRQMYKLQEFLDFFGRLDNPFNAASLERYGSRLKDLKSKYPNESDGIIKKFTDENLIKLSPNDNHLELTREGQDFINNGGFIKPFITEKKDKEIAWFYDIIKISAGIVALYYLIELLKEFMAFISYYFN
jgi:hypothetical protein